MTTTASLVFAVVATAFVAPPAAHADGDKTATPQSKTSPKKPKKPVKNHPNKPNEEQSGDNALFCRGGGSMSAEMFNSPRVSGGDQLKIRVGFAHGAQGVRDPYLRVERLEPGQCSWADRGMREGEPTLVQSWPTHDPALMTMFASVVECTRDEHCVFELTGHANRSSIQAVDSGRVNFWRVP